MHPSDQPPPAQKKDAPARRLRFKTVLSPARTNAVRPSFFFAGRGEQGFTLAEIAVALGIFSFALVSMMGMLSVGLKNTLRATTQTSASNLMVGIASDIKASTVETSPDGDTAVYTSPRLGLSMTLDKKKNTVLGAITSYVSESGIKVDPSSMDMIQKFYRVQISPGAESVSAVRVRVEWPAIRPTNSRPEGYLEALVPLPL